MDKYFYCSGSRSMEFNTSVSQFPFLVQRNTIPLLHWFCVSQDFIWAFHSQRLFWIMWEYHILWGISQWSEVAPRCHVTHKCKQVYHAQKSQHQEIKFVTEYFSFFPPSTTFDWITTSSRKNILCPTYFFSIMNWKNKTSKHEMVFADSNGHL